MEIRIKKLTDGDLMRRACEMTWRGNGKTSQMTLRRIYKCEHSPIRTQMFWIEMIDVASFVSVHFVRHKIGVEHFVMSNREDRGGSDNVGRRTPVNHGMLINAQALISMARKRLCFKAHTETRETMSAIKDAMVEIDPDLAMFMVPECVYRNGRCPESMTCGWISSTQGIDELNRYQLI